MSRPRLLTPLLALLALDCSPGGEDSTSTSFGSGPATTGGPGPSSFGGSDSSGAPTTSGATTPTTTTPEPTATGPTTTGSDTGSTSTTGSETTDTTADDSGTASSGTTGDTSTGTVMPGCGDGVVDDGELCDDGNRSDADACLGDCTAGTAVLALIGVGTQPAITATFTPGLGWTSAPAPMGVAAADLEATPEGAMAVIRRASAKPEEQGELYYARWQAQDPALFGMFAKVGAFGFTKDAPALAPVADTLTLAFLGTDNKHYTVLYSDGAWAEIGKLPAGMLNLQAFGPTGPGLAPGAIETYAFYTGDDARIYYTSKAGPGSSWAASQGSPPLAVLGTPVGLVDDEGDLLLAYVRKNDGMIALVKLLTPMNAWTKEVLIHPTAITGSAISMIRTDGGYAIAWRGFDNQGIYLATAATDAAWDAPLPVEVPKDPTTPPQLIPGVLGAEIEVLYTAGGKLRHARVADGALVPAVDVAGVAGATTVAATRVQRVP